MIIETHVDTFGQQTIRSILSERPDGSRVWSWLQYGPRYLDLLRPQAYEPSGRSGRMVRS